MSAQEAIALGEKITNRIVRSMQEMRSSTEHAALSIGELLNKIVRVATTGNNEVRQTLSNLVSAEGGANGESQHSITQAIESQSASVASFVGETRDFFKQQISFAQEAAEACDKITGCANSVSDLMTKSHLLALNMQIESARMGAEGRAFTVIGEEMKQFAREVRAANETIKAALGSLTTSIPQIQVETSKMDDRTTTFSERLAQELAEVKRQTSVLTDSLQLTLDRATERNGEVVKFSQATLSELQFQDPMAQKMQQAEFDVLKIQQLIAVGECNDIPLSEIDPAVGDDGSGLRETGVVELF